MNDYTMNEYRILYTLNDNVEYDEDGSNSIEVAVMQEYIIDADTEEEALAIYNDIQGSDAEDYFMISIEELESKWEWESIKTTKQNGETAREDARKTHY